MNKIKMIGLDIDGTLLNSEKYLTARTGKVLEQAMKQGVEVLIATGRPYSAIPKDLLLPGMNYILTANGARVIKLKEEKLIYESLLPPELAEKVLGIYEKYDNVKEIYYHGVGYTSMEEMCVVEDYVPDKRMVAYIRETRRTVESLRGKMKSEAIGMDKIQALFRSQEEKLRCIAELKQMEGITISGALLNNIEVNNEGVNKGAGLVRLGARLGIPRESIMACGDGMNDYDMLREAGFGVAMGNAVEAVKEIADYITDTNDEEGVANAIEQFVLNA